MNLNAEQALTCQVVKKLAVGELFTVEEGPVKQEDRSPLQQLEAAIFTP